MSTLKYTKIKTEDQYKRYCDKLEQLVLSDDDSREVQDEIELLTLLIEKWDEEHRLGPELDPVEMVRTLMQDHSMNQQELAEVAGVGKSYISEILNYKKRMSKKVIRNIAGHFKISQDYLNRYYELRGKDKEKRLSA